MYIIFESSFIEILKEFYYFEIEFRCKNLIYSDLSKAAPIQVPTHKAEQKHKKYIPKTE